MKYIDAEKLIAKIERLEVLYNEALSNPSFASYESSLIARGKHRQREELLSFINSLLQENVESKPKIKGWHKFSEELPPLGIEVLAYHHDWVDEDVNPNGTRIGFLQDNLASDDCHYDFVSAHYWNEQDDYITISKFDIEGNEDEFSDKIKRSIIPEYWIEIPQFSKET